MTSVRPLSAVAKFSNLRYAGSNSRYAFLGLAMGAGEELRGQSLCLYRDIDTGALYARTKESFASKMAFVPQQAEEANDVPTYSVGDVIRFSSRDSNMDSRAFRVSRRTPHSTIQALAKNALEERGIRHPGMLKSEAIVRYLVRLELGTAVTEETIEV